jgi:hypothetical protein
MTPNVARKALYCTRGRDAGSANHGPYNIQVKALMAVLQPLADRWTDELLLLPTNDPARRQDAERARLRRRMDSLDVRLDVGRMDALAYRANMADLLSQEKALDLVARQRGGLLSWRKRVSWEDEAEANAQLRRLWSHVQLDGVMHPTVHWQKWAGPVESSGA